MKESWKIYFVSAISSFVGSSLMRKMTDATTSETIGFILLIIGLVGCGIFLKTNQIEEQQKE